MMKKILPLLFVVVFTVGAQAQACMRDSSLLMTGKLLSPAWWDSITMEYNLADACITHPYNQSVTINVPNNFNGIPLNNVTVATTGAVLNLPVGLTYSCDPPNCVFNAGTLGCIRLYGIPTMANMAPDTFDLHIKVRINTAFGAFDLEFPNQLPGNNNDPHYYLALKDTQCLVGASDLNSTLGFVKSAPNPFSGWATITVESIMPGDFQFEVFNLVGQRVHARTIRLDAGINEFSFDGSALPNGSYFYSIGNQNGKATRRMVVAR